MSNDQTKDPGALRVHRDDRGGKKGLLWALLALLAVLVAAALLWWLLADDDDDGDVEAGSAQEEVLDDDAAADGDAGAADEGKTCGDDGTITDIAFLSDANGEDVEGCPVDLRDITVESVPSDKLFTIGTGADVIFVSVGNEPEVPPQDSEGRVDVNAGETLSLTGDMKTIASAEEAQAAFDVEPKVAEQLAAIGFYVLATSIDEQQ